MKTIGESIEEMQQSDLSYGVIRTLDPKTMQWVTVYEQGERPPCPGGTWLRSRPYNLSAGDAK